MTHAIAAHDIWWLRHVARSDMSSDAAVHTRADAVRAVFAEEQRLRDRIHKLTDLLGECADELDKHAEREPEPSRALVLCEQVDAMLAETEAEMYPPESEDDA